MKFVPRQPEEGINVSKTHPLAEAGSLLVGLTLIFVVVIIALVFMVELALYFIPVEKEVRLFRDWLPEDIVTVGPHDERLVAAQNLTDRLARRWPDAPYNFRVEIDDSDAPNAMAMPGGLIVITQGLLDQVESENELAFVIGHEIGHFRNRDHLRALGRVLVLTIAIAASSGGDSSGIGVNVADMTLRSFNRRQETRADEFGLLLVQSEYGHVNGAWRLFERWAEASDNGGSELVSYISTHPASAERVADLKALAAAEGWSQTGYLTPSPWESSGEKESPATSR